MSGGLNACMLAFRDILQVERAHTNSKHNSDQASLHEPTRAFYGNLAVADLLPIATEWPQLQTTILQWKRILKTSLHSARFSTLRLALCFQAIPSRQ